MKKTALFLCTALLFALLPSCGGVEGAERVAHVYAPTELIVHEGMTIDGLYAAEDGFAAVFTGDDETLVQTYDRSGRALEAERLSAGDGTVEAAALMSDGSVAYCLSSGGIYSLWRQSGGETSCILEDLQPLFDEKISYITQLLVDGDGDIYIAMSKEISVVTPEGKTVCCIPLSSPINGIGLADGGRVYAITINQNAGGSTFRYIDKTSASIDTAMNLPSSVNANDNELYIGEGFDLYVDDGQTVSGCDLETGELTVLCDWMNSDMIRADMREVLILDADTMLVSCRDYTTLERKSQLFLLNRVDDGDVEPRRLIEVAGVEVSSDVRRLLVKFNRQSGEYRAVVNSYEYTDGEKSPSERLKMDIVAGYTPDILVMRQYDGRDTYIDAGMFCDLYELMDADPDFDRKVLCDFVRTPFEREGKLYELVTDFQLTALVVKKSLCDADGWTVSEFLDFAESLPEGTHLIDDSSKWTMHTLLFTSALDEFIDTEAGTCNFDNDTFRRLLEFINGTEVFNYRKSLTGADRDAYNDDPWKPYRENQILLTEAEINSYSDYVSLLYRYGFEELNFIGYPGGGVQIEQTLSYGITAKSTVREGAWECLKFILDEQISSKDITDTDFRCTRAGMDAVAEHAESMHTFYYSSGSVMTWFGDELPEGYEEFTGVRRDITEADIAAVETMLTNVRAADDIDSEVTSIISEELLPYFEGVSTLDEVIPLIQDRAGTCLAEKQ
ncbi:MAG: extracellular solute-binding protein [Clostridia bacterium]|nr:extracellular solute-binding protein [Clostridia bacterium]